jgi:hypothetical protein
MRPQSQSIPLLATFLLLSACNQNLDAHPDTVEANGSIVAEAEAVAAAIYAQTTGEKGTPAAPAVAAPSVNSGDTSSSGGPKRRDGLWEMASYAKDGSFMARQSLCVGAGSEDTFSVWDQLTMFGNCSRKDLTRSGAGWTFDTRCELMGMVNEAKGTISGDFRDQFRVDQTIATEGRSITGSFRGVHKGSCPAPFKPGDLISDGRVLMNVLN